MDYISRWHSFYGSSTQLDSAPGVLEFSPKTRGKKPASGELDVFKVIDLVQIDNKPAQRSLSGWTGNITWKESNTNRNHVTALKCILIPSSFLSSSFRPVTFKMWQFCLMPINRYRVKRKNGIGAHCNELKHENSNYHIKNFMLCLDC